MKNSSADDENVVRMLADQPSLRYCPHGRPFIKQIPKREIEKYFDRDAYGNTDGYSFQRIIDELEYSRENYLEAEYTDKILRKQLIEHPPKGYNREKIKKMSVEELTALDLQLQAEEVGATTESKLAEKYKNLLLSYFVFLLLYQSILLLFYKVYLLIQLHNYH